MEFERRESAGTLVFRLIYPYLLYLFISLAVELIIVMPHCMELIEGSVGLDYDAVMDIVEDYIYSQAMRLTAISAVVVVPILYFFYVRDRKYWPVKEYAQCRQQPAVKYVYVALFGLILSLAFNNLFDMISISDISENFSDVSLAIDSAPLVWQVLATVVAAPLVEELLFRGLIYKRLRRHFRPLYCALISSLIFGITHGNLVQFLYAFAVGMALAYVFERYKNLWAPVLLHAMANLTAVTLAGMIGMIDSMVLRTLVVALELALSYGVFKLISQKVTDDYKTDDYKMEENS